MLNHPENEMQQTLTPEEVRQSPLARSEARNQAMTELSNEQLDEISGALSFSGAVVGLKQGWSNAGNVSAGIKAGFSSLVYGAKNGPGRDTVNYAIEQARKHTYGR